MSKGEVCRKTTAVLLIARRDVIEFYRLTFACYVIGLLVFLLYPAVAPDVYYPESLRADYLGTSTAALGRNLAADYSALGRGLPLNGFGYFVALPSLHVAMALLSQALLHAFPLHFWTFLPVNLLLIVSTVVLGHHYVVDVPAGALLAAFVLAAHRALRRCPFEQPAESR